MRTMAMTRRTMAIAAIALLAAGVVAACGDDDSDETSKQDDTPTTEAEASQTKDYCTAELKVEQTSFELGGPESDPVESATTLLAVVKKAAPLAPEEVAAKFTAAIDMLEGVVKTDDGLAMENFDTRDIHEVDLQLCGWSSTDVTAADYSFDGLPKTVDAGIRSFELHNEGTEPHVMVLVRKAAGVTDSWEDILAGDFEKDGKAVGVAAAFAPPGEDGYGVGDLEPGEYLAFCPITAGSSLQAEGDGPPHFMQGMTFEFTVA